MVQQQRRRRQQQQQQGRRRRLREVDKGRAKERENNKESDSERAGKIVCFVAGRDRTREVVWHSELERERGRNKDKVCVSEREKRWDPVKVCVLWPRERDRESCWKWERVFASIPPRMRERESHIVYLLLLSICVCVWLREWSEPKEGSINLEHFLEEMTHQEQPRWSTSNEGTKKEAKREKI